MIRVHTPPGMTAMCLGGPEYLIVNGRADIQDNEMAAAIELGCVRVAEIVDHEPVLTQTTNGDLAE